MAPEWGHEFAVTELEPGNRVMPARPWRQGQNRRAFTEGFVVLHKGKMMIGKICMVRTYSAGVFLGKLEERNGKEVRLTNARRMYYWDGAASLSQLATEGTSKPKTCKFPAPVAEVLLIEAIEIIPATEAAIASIAAVEEWSL